MRIAHRFVALTILLLSFVLAPVSVAHAAPSAPPTISGFWPGDTPSNTLVFVFGANFDATFGGTKVAINGINAPIVQVLDKDLLVFMLPAGDTAGPITVTTAAGTATSSAKFGPDPAPVAVNGFWPTEAVPGSVVFVFGKGLVPGSTKVKLNGQDTPIMQVLDSGLLFFMVPADGTTGTITVTTPAGVVITIDLLAVRRSGPITLIHTGDIHGALEGHINLRSDSTGRIEGGLARVYTKIKEIRARTPGKNLYINSGDTVQGSAEIMFTRGQAMIDVLNLFGGIDAHAPGNWDFLYGTDRFIETFVGKNGAPPLAPWNALAANLYYATLAQDPTTPYPDKAGQNVLPPYRTVFVNKMKVGIIGLTTVRGIPAVGASVNKGFFYTNGDASGEVKKYVDILRNKEKVDLVVITSELELANGVVLANKYPGIDVILSADMHERTTVPIVATTGTILVEEGEDAGVVGEVTLNIAGGKVQTWAFKQHAITDLIKEDPTIAAKIKEVIKPFHSGPDFNPNQSVTIGGNTTKLARPLDTVIGYTAVPLHRSNFSHEDMPAAVEGSGHNFLADAMRWATGADFAAIRGFRYGTHIPVGPITYGDLFHWIPLSPRIGKASPVFGGNLQDQVNQSTRSVFDPNPQNWRGGWMFGYSGVTYDLNASRPHGCRGKNIKVGGVPIDTKAYFKSVYLTSFADGSQVPTTSTATAKVTGRYDGYRPAIPATGAQPAVPEVLPTYSLTVVVKGISPAQLTAAHIHLGAAGTNGPVLVDLVGTAGWVATADGMSKTIGGQFPLANEADMLNGNTYVQLHTVTNPTGEIRGQLSILSSQMDGVQAGSGSPATGLVTGRYDRHLEEVVVTPTTPVAKPAVPGKYNLTIAVKGISPAELIGAHIHLGAAGTNGPVIVNLGTTGWVATADGMSLSASGDFPIVNEPDLLLGNTYVQLHTATNPTGAIRGQLPKPMSRSYKVAGYWFADDPSTINNCGACTGDSGGGIDVVKDPVTGEFLDLTEIVVNYLQSLPNQTANPSLHRITLTNPLPAPVYGFNEMQPLKGAPPAIGDVCP